jgi:hypothetical protein
MYCIKGGFGTSLRRVMCLSFRDVVLFASSVAAAEPSSRRGYCLHVQRRFSSSTQVCTVYVETDTFDSADCQCFLYCLRCTFKLVWSAAQATCVLFPTLLRACIPFCIGWRRGCGGERRLVHGRSAQDVRTLAAISLPLTHKSLTYARACEREQRRAGAFRTTWLPLRSRSLCVIYNNSLAARWASLFPPYHAI